jgi:hypothetical protein
MNGGPITTGNKRVKEQYYMGYNVRKFAGYRNILGLIPLFVLFLYLHLSSGLASCSEIYFNDAFSEKYYIDDQHVFLLYKIINWWYDCQPKDDYLLCGKTIKCTNLGNACIKYTQSKSTLKISIQKGLADQLSIFKTCNQCFGPSYLRCIWKNEKYLGKGTAAPTKNLNQFVFLHVNKTQAGILKNIEKKIVFVVQGNIRGLINDGKIALHNTGTILKRCPDDADDKAGIFPITVKIKNTSTNEMIAQYLGIWAN